VINDLIILKLEKSYVLGNKNVKNCEDLYELVIEFVNFDSLIHPLIFQLYDG
jgi:hypothetical protein